MLGSIINRRRYERFALPAMYTAITVRTLDQDRDSLEGHTYDISEGGVHFELDHPIEPGTPVAVEIFLPASVLTDDPEAGRIVFAFGNIVWADDSEPGPVRLAAAFTRFARDGDRERLVRAFASGIMARAA